MTRPTVAIQGQAGSFHHEAAKTWFGDAVPIVPCATFREVFDIYATGKADAIVTAIENTLYGSINEVYRLIESCSVPIIGEVKLAVDQMLIAQPGTTIADIATVYSHPVALAQCEDFLRDQLPHATLVEFFDTAGAVEFVANQQRTDIAAIGSSSAATLHKLPILSRSIQNNLDNITRFLVLQPHTTPHNPTRASLLITTDHTPGTLVEVLQLFADAGINLAKLQSQPIVGQPWRYAFFIVVDCAGDRLHRVLDDIERRNHTVRVLGEYHKA